MNKTFSYINVLKIFEMLLKKKNKTKGLHILLFKILDETYL